MDEVQISDYYKGSMKMVHYRINITVILKQRKNINLDNLDMKFKLILKKKALMNHQSFFLSALAKPNVSEMLRLHI